MKQVKFNISVKLIEDELSSHETNPELNIFLDARFKRTPITIGLNEQNVEIYGKLHNDIYEIPQTASIVISGFANRRNNFGAICKMDIGTNHIPIVLITNNEQKVFELPLIMHTIDNYEKAKLQVTVNSYDMAGIKIVNQKYIGNNMLGYINNIIKAEEHMPDTIPGTSKMRIPYDYSESGLELTNGTPLPAIAYVMSETPISNTLYWKNVYNVIMKRDNLDKNEWKRLSKNGKARVTGLMICYLSQYLDYIGDTIDRNTKRKKFLQKNVIGCENFGDSLSTWSGDCEDLGTGILQCYNALVSHKFKSKDKLLKEIQQIAKQYIPLLSLDAVNGAQVSDKNAPKGAHMNDNLVPIHQFRAWMRTLRDGRVLDKKLRFLYPTNIDKELPIMIGDGTGMLEPLGIDNPNVDICGYIYQLKSLKGFKKPIFRKRGEAGSFLVGSLTGMTDYFIKKGINIGSMWYTSLSSNNTVTRGAYYNDMINDHMNIGIKMHESIPKNNMNIIREGTMFRDPPHKLVLTDEHNYNHEKNKHLDHIVEKINSLNRKSGSSKRYVPIYVRPHQIDENIAERIAYGLKNLNRVWKVSYELERITDIIHGYEMRIYVK